VWCVSYVLVLVLTHVFLNLSFFAEEWGKIGEEIVEYVEEARDFLHVGLV
jgi:hypothetical protein